MLKDKVNAYKGKLLEETSRLLQFESTREPESGPEQPFGRENAAALDYYLELGRKLGFEARNFSGFAGHVEFGQGEEVVGVLCHLDVVPAGDDWTVPPFSGQIVEGKIYGRGAVDNKGPAVACLYALAALRDSGYTPTRRIRVIVGCDEESHWQCMDHYLSKTQVPDLGFAPDAEFPIINAEKGIFVAGLQGPGPPCHPWRLLSIEGGNRPNMVPDRCRVRLSREGSNADCKELLALAQGSGAKVAVTCTGPVAELEFSGVSAHGSLPHLGDNAVYHALRFLKELGLGQGLVGLLAEKLAFAHDGSGLNIKFSDEESGHLTVNLGVIRGDSETVDVKLDIRYPVTFAEEQVVVGLKEALGSTAVLSREGSIRALHMPADSHLVRALQGVYTKCTGEKANLLAIGGGTYARALENAVAFGPVFPGQAELAHQRDEHIGVEELLKLTWIYAEAMAALGGGK